MAVRVIMAPAETGPPGEIRSVVVVGEMVTAFKLTVAAPRIRKAVSRFTIGRKMRLLPSRNVSDAVDRAKKFEVIVLFFDAWSELVRFPIGIILYVVSRSRLQLPFRLAYWIL